MLPFITDTSRKYKRRAKRNTGRAGEAAPFPGKTDAPCVDMCVPEASVLLSAEMRVRGTTFWAGFFFLFLPREQTMVSWNNAADESLSKENKALTSWVLKARSWANTLSCYNQASVNFHCWLKLRKRRISCNGSDTFFFFFFLALI